MAHAVELPEGVVVVVVGGVVVVVVDGVVVVVVVVVPPPPLAGGVTGVEVGFDCLTGAWCLPTRKNWWRLDSVAKTPLLWVGPLTDGATAFGDAEASRAIMLTKTQVVRASVATLGMRCVVSLVNNFLIWPLFMLNKFTDLDHTSAYDHSTFTQLS